MPNPTALPHDCCWGVTAKIAFEALIMYLAPGAQDWTDCQVEAMIILRGGANDQGDPDPDGGDPIGLWIRGHFQPSPTESQWVSGYYNRAGHQSRVGLTGKVLAHCWPPSRHLAP